MINPLHRELEAVEVAAWTDFCRAARSVSKSVARTQLHTIGSGVCTVVPDEDVLALNRSLGLGLDASLTVEDLDQIKDIYRDAGVPRFFLQLLTEIVDEQTGIMLREAGFEHYNNWVKLHRLTTAVETKGTDLTIAVAGPEQAEAFGKIVAASFEWSEDMAPGVSALVGRENWHCYVALDGDRPVATGGFYRQEETAWIDLATTLPEYRGRGAQSSLLQRRVEDAAALGCTKLVVETAQETPDHSAPSYRNMIRYGFTETYVRPNYIYRF